jgi:cyclopropane fatty-acyl-phospholipid synthase-like methyltransferase
MPFDDRLGAKQFGRSSKYNPDWIMAGASGGANSLWLTEWLASAIDLRPGMRVLDLGCGRACSSIFLHREFGVEVWATDLWFSASENLRRIQDAGVGGRVFPLKANARALPFAAEFFDAILSVDSFVYYGTDDLYLNYLARFLRPRGHLGVAQAGLTREMGDSIPEHLRKWWTSDLNCLHSADWWSRHWNRSGVVDVELADTMPDGWRLWAEWHKVIAPHNQTEIDAIEADQGSNLGYVRAIARRRVEVDLSDPVESISANYTQKELLRETAARLQVK